MMKTIAKYSDKLHRWIVICTLYGKGGEEQTYCVVYGVGCAVSVRESYRKAYRKARSMGRLYRFSMGWWI